MAQNNQELCACFCDKCVKFGERYTFVCRKTLYNHERQNPLVCQQRRELYCREMKISKGKNIGCYTRCVQEIFISIVFNTVVCNQASSEAFEVDCDVTMGDDEDMESEQGKLQL